MVFFQSDRDICANYGAIGAVIGHEATHGFDDQGRQFDCNGMQLLIDGNEVVFLNYEFYELEGVKKGPKSNIPTYIQNHLL